MAMKCPSCGGYLEFDIESQKLKCSHCESVFDPQQYNLKNEAEKQSFQEEDKNRITVDVYSCKNCGAELCAPAEQIVAFCMYCGGQATLLQKAATIRKPVGIIPFKISKEKVRELYSNEIAPVFFLPSALKKSNFLEGFRGIYIPYWKFYAEINSDLSLTNAEKKDSKGCWCGYYDVKARCFGRVYSGTHDASDAFDDTLASAISPYTQSSVVPFNEAYLSGFYADMATVKPQDYHNQLQVEFPEFAQKEFSKCMDGIHGKVEQIKKQVKPKGYIEESHLFPVWFLTWRKGKRVCYSVMNGETGTLTIDLPVDYFKFFLWAIILSFIASELMCSLPVFIIPLKVAAFSSFLLYTSSVVFKSELKKVNQIETHFFDIGSSLRKNKDVKELSDGLFVLNSLQYVAAFLMLIPSLLVTTTDHLLKFFVVMITFQLIEFIKQCRYIVGIKNVIGIVPVFLSFLVQVGGTVVAYNNIQADIFHYGISVCCLVAMIVNIIASVFYINYLNTRPVPNFYAREGAKNGR